MGLVRSLAKKVVGRVLGHEESPSRPAPSASKAAPARPAPQAAPVRVTEVAPGEPVADKEALARIECGAQELKERLDAGETVVIVDVREPFETAQGILPEARLIPLRQLYERWEELKEANEIVCYCAGGGRSLEAASFLRQKGLFNATSMEGGMFAWRSIQGTVVMPPESGGR
jgi:rhodanese-related sulfurtransferase